MNDSEVASRADLDQQWEEAKEWARGSDPDAVCRLVDLLCMDGHEGMEQMTDTDKTITCHLAALCLRELGFRIFDEGGE
jgi:hypothetical protein